QTATGKEISNPFMAGSLPKTILLTFIHAYCCMFIDDKVSAVKSKFSAVSIKFSAAAGDVSAAHGEVPTVHQTPPQSPQVQPPSPQPQPQPQPQQAAEFPMSLLQEVMDTCDALTRRVKHLDFDKRVETFDDAVMDDESNQGRMIAEMDQDDAVILKDDKEEDREVADEVKVADDAKEDETEPAKVQEVVDIVTIAKLIIEVVTADSEAVTTASTIITTAEAQVPAAILTAAPARVAAAPSRIRKGVAIRDPEKESTTSIIIPAENKSKDKGKGILDEAIDHVKMKAKEDPAIKRYQVLKRKPQTKAQARKNMMVYLKNVTGFKMDYFKGLSYDDIRPVFEKYFDSNSSKDQMMEATGIMWCADHNIYIYPSDYVIRKEIPSHKIYSRPDVEYCKTKVEEESEVSLELLRRRKGVVIRDPKEESTTSTMIPAETKSKDKGKGILDEAIDHVKRKAKEDTAMKKYQAMKRKPQAEAQARKNMMMYLKNVAGFKMDYFKGMSYDDIRPIFEAKFNSNVAFFLKTKV
nr:hypothetical protein [Tanacetum cinerariifolium]